MAVIGALLSVLSLAGWLVPVGVAEADDAVLVQIIDTSAFPPPQSGSSRHRVSERPGFAAHERLRSQ